MFGWKRAIIVLVVLQVALGLARLNSIPRIYIDEVWDSSLGYNLARTGSLGHPFVEGLGGMDIHYLPNRVVMPLVSAAIFTVADYSIATSRSGSLILSVLAIVSLYGVMRRWFGEKQAFLIALATIINPWFFEVSRRARPEIYYTALGLVLLWLIVIFVDTGSRRSAFFAGVVAGLSALAHPNGIILVFSIGCTGLVWLKVRPIGRLIQWASIGFAIVVLPYIVYVLWALQDPRINFAEQMQASTWYRMFLKTEITRWKHFLQLPKGIPLAIVLFASWTAAWFRSSAREKYLAGVIGLFVLILPFVSVNQTPRYLAATVPFFSALIVRLIWRIVEGKGAVQKAWKWRSGVGLSVGVVYLSMCVGGITLMFYCLRGADFGKVIDRVASVVGPEDRVYGDPIFWVGHDRYRYGPYPITFKGVPFREAMEMVRKHDFDYAIRTVWFIGPPEGIAQLPRSMPKFRNNRLCDHLCRLFGTKVDEFYDPYYGPIEIYKLNRGRPVQYWR